MADNRRQVELALQVTTANTDAIGKLRESVKALAKEGAQIAPAFEEADAALAQLGEQVKQLQTIEKLAPKLAEVSQKQQELKEKSKQLATEMKVLAATTAAAQDELDRNKVAHLQSVAAYQDATNAIKLYNQGVREEGVALTKLVADATAAQRVRNDMRVAIEKSRQALAEANKAEAEHRRELNQTEKVLASTTKTMEGLEKRVQTAAKSMEEAGGAAGDLAAKQEALQAAWLNTQANLAKAVTELEAVAAAEREAAAAAEATKRAYDERVSGLNALLALRRQESAEAAKAADAERKAQDALLKDWLAAIDARAAAESAALAKAEKERKADHAARIDELNTRVKFAKQAAEEQAAAEKAAAAAAQKAQAETQRSFIDGLNARIKWVQQESAARTAAATKAAQEAKQLEREQAALQDKLQEEARQTEQAFREAYGAMGGKNAATIREQIDTIRKAMETLATSGRLTGRELDAAMAQGNASIKRLERDLREATGTMTLMDKASRALGSTVGQVAGWISLYEVVTRTGSAFYEATKQIQSMQLGLKAIYGDAGMASSQIEVLRKVANDAGMNVGELSNAFTKFSAAMKGAGMSTDQSNKLFAETIRVSGLMGLSTARTERALEAMSQMATKGVVSLEELNQQLGDAMPNALGIAAKGLGMTNEELMKMVSTGAMPAKLFFEGFTKGLRDLEGQNNTLAGAVARLQNAITQFFQQASDSTAVTALTQGLNSLATNFGTVIGQVLKLGQAYAALKILDFVRNLDLFGKSAVKAATDVGTHTAALAANTAATTTNTATTTANTAAKSANAAAWTSLAAALGGATAATTTANTVLTTTGGVIAQSGKAAADAAVQKGVLARAMGGLAAAGSGVMAMLGGPVGLVALTAIYAKDIGELAAKLVLKAQGLKTLEQAEAELAAQEKKLADETAKRAQAQADAATTAEAALTRQMAALKQLRETVDAKTAADEKNTEAAKRQGEVLTQIAGMRDDERVSLEAAAQAALLLADATAQEATSKQALVVAIQQEIDALKILVELNPNSVKLKEELQARMDLLAAKKAEAEATEALAEKTRLEVQQREMAVAALQDNSSRLAEYRQQVMETAQVVGILQQKEREGFNVSGQLQKARAEQAKAEAQYSDALRDTITAIEAKNKATQAQAALVQSKLELQKAELTSALKIAEAQGNEAEAVRLKIEIKRKEIEIIQSIVKAQIAEAQSSIDVAKAKLAEVQGSDDNARAKRAELEATIKNAEASINQAKARGESVKAIQAEIDALQNNSGAQSKNADTIDDATSALERQNDARERAIAAQEKEIELKEREDALERKRRGVDKDGYSVNENGERYEATVFDENFITQRAKAQGLSDAETVQLIDKFLKGGHPVGSSSGLGLFGDLEKAISEMQSSKVKERASGQDMIDNAVARGGVLRAEEVARLEKLGLTVPDAIKPQNNRTQAPSNSGMSGGTTSGAGGGMRSGSGAVRGGTGGAGGGLRGGTVRGGTGGSAMQPNTPTGGGLGGDRTAPTYVSNITIPGVGSTRLNLRDADSQAKLEGLIKTLATSRGASLGSGF